MTDFRILASNAAAKFTENMLSKKMLVFITATMLLDRGHLPSSEWLVVALSVLGVVGVLDFRKGQSLPMTDPNWLKKKPVEGTTQTVVTANKQNALAIP